MTGLTEAEEAMLSALARVEVMSAFYHRLCRRLWNRSSLREWQAQFEKDTLQQRWGWLPVDDAVIRVFGPGFICSCRKGFFCG